MSEGCWKKDRDCNLIYFDGVYVRCSKCWFGVRYHELGEKE